jgi:cell division inhibitor SepF
MGILDDLKKWAHPYEDEDEEYEDTDDQFSC